MTKIRTRTWKVYFMSYHHQRYAFISGCFLLYHVKQLRARQKKNIINCFVWATKWENSFLCKLSQINIVHQVYYTMRKCSINLNLWQHARSDKALVKCKISHLNCKVARNFLSLQSHCYAVSRVSEKSFRLAILNFYSKAHQETKREKVVVMEKDENIFSHC